MNAPWKPNFGSDDPRDCFDRKFTQAEALAHSLVGDEFFTFNEDLQRNVLWLLASTLTEAREALEKSEAKAQ